MSNRWDAGLYEGEHSFVWKYGAALLPLLDPKPGESILDVGCGTGQLTSEIAAAGAATLGIDSSAAMIGQARQNFPKLNFQLADVCTFAAPQPFDAVFSNATLHWVKDARGAVRAIRGALRPGGRMVVEFGGRGNTGRVMEALAAAGAADPLATFYYPSISEYTGILESEGFEVRFATLFDRSTELEDPERGLEQWLRMFLQRSLDTIPSSQLDSALRKIEDRVRSELFYEGKWHVDYRRLRVIAVRS